MREVAPPAGEASRRAVLRLGAAAIGSALIAPAVAGKPLTSLPRLKPIVTDGLVNYGSGLDNAIAFMKMLTTFGDTPVFGGLSGKFFALVGEEMVPVFGYAGYRYHQSRLVPGPDGSPILEVRGKEAGLYTDLATGLQIDHWRNPWTGETVTTPPWLEPGRVEAFPPTRLAGSFFPDAGGTMSYGGLTRKAASIDAPALPFQVNWRRIGTFYANSSDSSNRFLNPVTPEGWPLASTGKHVSQHELLKTMVDAHAIDDPSKAHAPFTGVLTRNMPWLPFTRMGKSGVEGRMTGILQIYKATGTIDDVPVPLRRFLERAHPEQLEPMTSWQHTVVKPGGTWQHYARTTPPEVPGYTPG